MIPRNIYWLSIWAFFCVCFRFVSKDQMPRLWHEEHGPPLQHQHRLFCPFQIEGKWNKYFGTRRFTNNKDLYMNEWDFFLQQIWWGITLCSIWPAMMGITMTSTEWYMQKTLFTRGTKGWKQSSEDRVPKSWRQSSGKNHKHKMLWKFQISNIT